MSGMFQFIYKYLDSYKQENPGYLRQDGLVSHLYVDITDILDFLERPGLNQLYCTCFYLNHVSCASIGRNWFQDRPYGR
jgi:hypothetical protein